jgi:hypothetical protein
MRGKSQTYLKECIMNLFSKKIETKRDHHAELKASIDDAVNQALKASVGPAFIEQCLDAWKATLGHYQRQIDDRRNIPTPRAYVATESGIHETDYTAMAKAEERRLAEELRRQQAEYQHDLQQKSEA